jgi:hypothetical protein
MRKAYFVVLALLAVSACNSGSDLTQPNVIEAALPGTWAISDVVPGSGTTLHLTVTETAISGDGTYAIEAGQGGTLSVQGEIAGSRVIIDFTRSDGIAAHYDATLKTHDVLRGNLSYDSAAPHVVEFHRVTP